MVGEFQRVHRGEAAHEADDGALHAVAQAGLAHDLEVEARCGEAGTARDDQMGDGGAFVRDVERGDRLGGERERGGFVAGHAGCGAGEGAAAIECLAVENVIARLRAGGEDRVAVLDVGQSDHAVEQRGGAIIQCGGAAEIDEFGVDVVRRHRGADAIEPGLGHRGLSECSGVRRRGRALCSLSHEVGEGWGEGSACGT